MAPEERDDAAPLDVGTAAHEAEAAKARAEAARARAIELRRKAEEARAASIEAGTATADTADAVDTADTEGDAPEAATVSTDTAQPEAGRARRRRLPKPRWSLFAAAVGVVLLCGLIAASGYLVKVHRDAVQDRQRDAEYSAAARQGVVNIMAINFNTAEADVQRVVESSTGDFKKQFEDTSQDLIKALKESKVMTEVNVNGVAVESMTPESAVVLVSATTQRGDADMANRDPRTWRVLVTVAREGGQLKVSQIDYV